MGVKVSELFLNHKYFCEKTLTKGCYLYPYRLLNQYFYLRFLLVFLFIVNNAGGRVWVGFVLIKLDSSKKKNQLSYHPVMKYCTFYSTLHSFTFHELSLPLFFFCTHIGQSVFILVIFHFKFSSCSFAIKMKNMNGRRNLFIFFYPCILCIRTSKYIN